MKQFSIFNFQFSINCGFTLIEVLVVIALMSILMLSSVGVFFSYTKSQSFQTGVADVVALLNKAKSRSLTQVKPAECDTNSLQGYQVSLTPSGSSYQLEGLCGGEVHILETKELPSQIIFADTSASSVIFNASSGIVEIPADFVITGFDKSKTISIDGVGNISVQ